MIEKLDLFSGNWILDKEMLKSIENKINEIIDYLNKPNNTKKFFLDTKENKLYFNEECEYIKKEDLKEYLERNIKQVEDKIEKYNNVELNNFYRGYKECLEIIKINYSL